MKKILYRLFEHQSLDREEARQVLVKLSRGEYNDSQIAAFITVFLMRSITIDELAGFRDALLEMRTPVDLGDRGAVDIVGTGGDNKNTFNISTAACFVVAGAGYPVVKHGNYGSTSVSGASNVMEHHGVRFTADTDRLRRSLDTCGVAYLHAPLFSPALKAVAPVRKALGVRNFFNMLGPLVNPTLPRRQMLGVYSLRLARLYTYLYQEGACDFTVVHSLDGYDEISLTSDFKCLDRGGERIRTPESLGFVRARESDLHGGTTIGEATAIFDRVLAGTGTPAQIGAVVANAAFAIRMFEPESSLGACVTRAREALDSGAALHTFKKFIEINS
jgi:anthranilate phosphoribosyltransferase